MTICKNGRCKSSAHYNSIGTKAAIYCSKCKLPNMVNIRHKKCLFEGCLKHPIFNLPGEKKPIFCHAHKSEDMVDIIHKKCIFEGCQTQPSYNLPGEKTAIFCKAHKSDDMVDIKNKRCIFEYHFPAPTKPAHVSNCTCLDCSLFTLLTFDTTLADNTIYTPHDRHFKTLIQEKIMTTK